MPERIAIKKLTASDLSFFETHFRSKDFGDHRQKAINLNADVFVDQFFPTASTALSVKWPVLVTFFGPGSAPAWSPPDNRRPITYNNGKNWRLNGGTIPDDPSRPERFSQLRPGDFALLRFRGDPAPTEVDIVLISAAVPDDTAVHAALSPALSRVRAMRATSPEELGRLIGATFVASDPSIVAASPDPKLEAEVEDVALGGVPGPMVRRRAGGRKLTPEELATAKAKAEAVGADGEEIVHSWLKEKEAAGEVSEVDWVSQRDAAAPMDFRLKEVVCPLRSGPP